MTAAGIRRRPADRRQPLLSARAARRELDRQVLDAVDERRAQLCRLAGDADVGEALEQLAEHHRDLAPREVRPEAEVRSRATEADVRVGRTTDVEVERIRERRLV